MNFSVFFSGIAQIRQERKEFDKALSLYQESLDVGRGAFGDMTPLRGGYATEPHLKLSL
jgi:hypothetical protein